MLELNPEIVCLIIIRAREFHAKEQVVLPDEPFNPGDDWALQTLADHMDDLTYREVVDAVEDLEPDQQADLVALMWLGRGDFEVDEWHAAVAQALEQNNDRVAEYLLATPLVADYLEEGLDLLGYSCDE